MWNSEVTCLSALTTSGKKISIWTASVGEAELIAEAFHDARPTWPVSINGLMAVFSSAGKVVDLTRPASGCLARVKHTNHFKIAGHPSSSGRK
jgi:hypothetical protein